MPEGARARGEKEWVPVLRRGDGEASLTQGQGNKEMLRRVAAHRHGENFNADIDDEHSHKMGMW